MTTRSSDRAATRGVVRDWQEVQPGRVYSAADVASLLGVSVSTVISRARGGRIRHLPRLSPKEPLRFLGASLLALLGDVGAALARGGETTGERAARAEAAKRRVRELAAGTTGGK
jgi:hypothetical protein